MKPGVTCQMFDTGPCQYMADCKPKGLKVIWGAFEADNLPVYWLEWFEDKGIELTIAPHFGSYGMQSADAFQCDYLLKNPALGAERFDEIANSFYRVYPKWKQIFVGNEFGIRLWLPLHSEFIERLSPLMRDKGRLAGFGVFPVGNIANSPNAPRYHDDPMGMKADLKQQWEPFKRGIDALIAYDMRLVLNQYAPDYPLSTDGKFFLYRHELLYEAGITLPKLVLGECGLVDRGGPIHSFDQRGWKAVMGEAQAAQEVQLMAARLDQSPVEITDAFVFGGWLPYGPGEHESWESFDIAGVEPIKQVLRLLKDRVWEQPQNGGNMPYEYVLGFKSYAAAHPAVGEAYGPLVYDAHGNALQRTKNGYLVWWKHAQGQGDEIDFYPKL